MSTVDTDGTVPRMTSQTLHQARRLWSEAGFRPNLLTTDNAEGQPIVVPPSQDYQYMVQSQTPAAFTKLDKVHGTGIVIVIAIPPGH